MTLTYGNLLNYHNQIQKQISNNTVCSYFNRSKIKEFYNDHGLRIQTAIRELGDLDARYLISQADGTFEMEEKDGKKYPKIKEGFTSEQYQEEINKILLREVVI